MKNRIEALLKAAIDQLGTHGIQPSDGFGVSVERAKDPKHGDFASNIAMVLAKQAGLNPRQLAEKIIGLIPEDPELIKVEIAGPGFINFHIHASSRTRIISEVLKAGEDFGKSAQGNGQKIQVEFVSANPTGPLHVGHGRGAAYGAVVSNLLRAVGFQVEREYYVNDAGRQMDILAVSVWLRYLERLGHCIRFPSNGYRGEYVREIAEHLEKSQGQSLEVRAEDLFENLPPDEPQGGDKEAHIDALIQSAKNLLGTSRYRALFDAGLSEILEDIRQDLEEFGVCFDRWYSERSLEESGAVAKCIQRLKNAGFLYEKEGATWFASTRFEDEKDRVVVRENGQTTYFASDIAYHMEKLERGYDRVIDVWGADHHGYIPRVKAAMEALDQDSARLEVLLVQFAVLYRGEEKVQMSTRSGEFVTLRQLRNEVGKDAARFFYVLRKSDQHMDFDLKLATSRTNENPVYYVQYAHARIASVFRQLDEKALIRDKALGGNSLDTLREPTEIALLTSLQRYPEVIESAAQQYAPHHLVHYLRELAAELHGYYNAVPFLVDDAALRNARLNLIEAIQQVLKNGLALLDVSAPESM